MWVHTGRLPHVLASRCYYAPEHHARERVHAVRQDVERALS